MAGFYSHDYFNNPEELSHGYADYDEMRHEREITFDRYLRRIVPHLKRREQVLDIGCGYGYFLEAARHYFPRLAGIDVSAEALQRADPQFELVCGEFRPGLFPGGFADLVMMCDLVEHLYRPVEFLRHVKEAVHPAGLLCLITPNKKSLLSRMSGKRWVSYKLPEHVCYYDPNTINRLLRESGFRMIRCSPCGQYATLKFLSKRLLHLLFKRDALVYLPEWLQQRVVYVNSGSMMVLAERDDAGIANERDRSVDD